MIHIKADINHYIKYIKDKICMLEKEVECNDYRSWEAEKIVDSAVRLAVALERANWSLNGK